MKNAFVYIVISIVVVSFYSCKDNDPTSIDSELSRVFFYNSFESGLDTIGWTGVTEKMFANDPCPIDSKRSLHIGGGCMQPTASIELNAIKEGFYKLNFWAKMGQKSQAAQVKLKAHNNSEESKKLVVLIDSTHWRPYESDQSLFVQANSRLILEIWVGGIIYADVFIDNLKIERTTILF